MKDSIRGWRDGYRMGECTSQTICLTKDWYLQSINILKLNSKKKIQLGHGKKQTFHQWKYADAKPTYKRYSASLATRETEKKKENIAAMERDYHW